MDDEDDDVPTCPLCLEELDATDRAVKACQCGYQVCLWCLHTIREQLNQRCPACRTPYEEQNFKIGDVNPEEAAKEVKERRTAKKERERREKLKEIERERERALLLSQQKAKSNLQHVRILQRNLVYIIGLSLSLAREEVIRRNDMFGKFGKMLRVLVNRSHPFHADAPGGPSISAYVQYQRDIDAGSAVRAMNNAVLDGREIRCAIATSKYCEAFVAGAQTCDITTTAFYHCGNANCLYYHTTAPADTILTREEVLARQLGPPPSSHLFLPIIPRRPGPSSINRSANSQLATQGLSTSVGAVSSNRHSANSVAPSQSHCTTSTLNPFTGSSQSLPPGVPPDYPQVSCPLQTTMAVPTSKSPLSSSTSPRVTEGINLFPKSPSGSQSEMKQANALAQNSQATNPYTLHPSSLQLPVSGVSASLPSSSTWASTQPGHPIAQPSRKPALSQMYNAFHEESSVKRRLVQSPRLLFDAPPGFEIAGSSGPSSPLPSKPPGFDDPLKSFPHCEEDSGTSSKGSNLFDNFVEDMPTAEKGQSRNSALPPPLEFESYQGLHGGEKESDEQYHASEWLRKAHSDEVFPRRDRVASPFVHEIERHNAVLEANTFVDKTTDASGQLSSNLHQPLASTGKPLDNASKFQDEPVLLGLHEAGSDGLPLRSHLSKFVTDKGKVSIQRTDVDPASTKDEVMSLGPDTRQIGHPTLESRVVSNPEKPMGLGSSETMRSIVTVAARRKHSRFVFARREDLEADSRDRVIDFDASGKCGSFGGMLSRSHFGLTNSEPTGVRGVSKFPEPVAPKKGPVGRHARSRFDFVDQSHPSSLNYSHGKFQSMEDEEGPFSVANSRARMGSRMQGASMNGHKLDTRDDNLAEFGGPEVQEITERTAQSFKWPTKDAQPALNREGRGAQPFVNSKISKDVSVHANIAGLKGKGNSSVYGDSKRVSTTELVETSNVGDVRSLDENRGPRALTFYPPGFGGGTSGIPPDINSSEKATVTGMADRATSGGDKSATGFSRGGSERNEILSGAHGIEEHTSSGAETMEEDRRKNRTQKKRDRKRGGRDPTERKMVRKDTAVDNSSQFEVKSFGDGLFKRGPAHPSISAQTSEDAKCGGFGVSDNEDWQDRLKADKGEESVIEDSEAEGELPGPSFCKSNAAHSVMSEGSNILKREGSVSITNPATAHCQRSGDESGRFMSVSELEREVEAARAREAQLQDKLMEITRRLRSYDNVRS